MIPPIPSLVQQAERIVRELVSEEAVRRFATKYLFKVEVVNAEGPSDPTGPFPVIEVHVRATMLGEVAMFVIESATLGLKALDRLRR